MDEIKHTGGPWLISGESAKIIVEGDVFGRPTNTLIGSACGHPNSGFYPTDEEAIANAQLMAAAPEMFEALAAVAEAYRHYEQKGEICPFEGNPMIYAETLVELGEKAAVAIAKATGSLAVRFANTSCSQCGADFGPGNSGFSDCDQHAHLKATRA